MNITVKNEYRVEAEVSADEMDMLRTDFGSLDYASKDTRMFLWNILEEIRAEGIDVDMSGRVLIEAFDNGTGGCTVAFTVLPEKNSDVSVKQLVKNISDNALISSEELDSLICFSRSSDNIRSELYYYDGKYCLFLFPNDGDKKKLSKILPEYFGVCSGNVTLRLAECREKGSLLRSGDAVHMLSRLYKTPAL